MSDIHFERRGAAGLVTLDRQDAMNAVTGDMLHRLEEQLIAWADDEAVRHVVIRAVPGRAFSVGGDIRHLYERGRAGEPDLAFFEHEYRLNARIKHYPKPYIAVVDGLVMGGGVGISLHGSHVVGARMQFAMPEVGIGFFPDVGATFILSRLPDALGMELALTGNRLAARECLAAGVATHLCEPDEVETVIERLCEHDVDEALAPSVKRADLLAQMEARDPGVKAFALDSVADILQRLRRWGSKEAQTMVLALGEKSPTSLCIAHSQIKVGERLDFAECMQLEYRIVSRILHGHDFYEGIRARIIDKDREPRWQPPTLDEVDPEAVAAHLRPLERELDLSDIPPGPAA